MGFLASVNSRHKCLPILQTLSDVMQADMVLVGQVDEPQSIVTTVDWYGMAKDHALKFNVPIGQCLIGLTAATGEPHHSPDLPSDRRAIYSRLMHFLGMKSVICQPIEAGGRPSGVLTVIWKDCYSPTTEEQMILRSIADVLSLLMCEPNSLTAFFAVQSVMVEMRLANLQKAVHDLKSMGATGETPTETRNKRIMQLMAIGRDKIQKLIRYEREHDVPLLDTLIAHFTAGSIREACSRLFIHANTYRYRLRRIQEITSLDFDIPGHRFLLMLGLYSFWEYTREESVKELFEIGELHPP